MDRNIIALVLGGLTFAGATLILLASTLPGVEIPAGSYVLVGVGLFAGIVLIGISHPDRPV